MDWARVTYYGTELNGDLSYFFNGYLTTFCKEIQWWRKHFCLSIRHVMYSRRGEGQGQYLGSTSTAYGAYRLNLKTGAPVQYHLFQIRVIGLISRGELRKRV